MRVAHTALSRLAVAASALLVVIQLIGFFASDHDSYVAIILLTLVLATAAATAKLHRDYCVESRLAVALLAAVSAAGVVLTATVGLPGQDAHSLGLLGASTVALSIAVMTLLGVDQARRAAEPES